MSSGENDGISRLGVLIVDAIIDDDLMRGAVTTAMVAEPGRVLATVDGTMYVITIAASPDG
ncbi:hypothetical protein ABIA33_004927 [Streptacidiphilus sp. MAP12-16]|uniref:hypothetical protein n=1 Tax=Streptacidiphilus sp. MAP12-16 TaxID=3156300 RepID=UPI003518423D